jgi:primosomal protein N' (replication factor Y)
VLDAVRRTVRGRGRAILLVDRKGYAGGLQCAECGAVERCSRCGVAMAYDRQHRRLHCRLCGRERPAPDTCTRCDAPRLLPVGAGTERVTAAIRRFTAHVWRFDSDVIRPGQDPTAALAPFRAHAGVLVATALVLPYLEGLRPNLIAVVAADRLLHRPEYRAAERALALLRMIGMASRAQVLVETAAPGHPAVAAATAPSLRPFYDDELRLREQLGYPPFRTLVALTLTAARTAALEMATARVAAAASSWLEVLGPISPPVSPGARRVTHELVIKTTDRAAAQAVLVPLVTGRGMRRDVRVAVDVDPHEI